MFVRLRVGSLHFVLVFFLALSLAACWKKSGDAIVLEKEHIDAAERQPSVTPAPSLSDADRSTPEYVERELAPDEIPSRES
jgi:hypothetical protein